MKEYIYDGTFEGLLTCIYESYYTGMPCRITPQGQCQTDLLTEQIEVVTDRQKSQKVYTAVQNKISRYDLRRIYRVFLSSADEKEMKILRYLRLGFKKGAQVSNLHGEPVVFDVQEAEQKVSFEAHRLYGLVRFSELRNGVMYSVIEPDHDVLELMAGHFVGRFRSAPFILHDKKRRKAVIADNGRWYIAELSEQDCAVFSEKSEDEAALQALWKTYFDNIAIMERKNSRCQRNYMPVRYWKNLPEMRPDVL